MCLGIKVKDDPTIGFKMEGDIAIENLRKFIDDNNKLGRNAIRQVYRKCLTLIPNAIRLEVLARKIFNYYRKWPNREIPYTLSSQYGSYARSVIAKAMQEYHDKTCVRFVPRDPARHVDYIFIHPDDGCYSLVGKLVFLRPQDSLLFKTGGRQPVSLDSGCIQVGTIVHELMHTVGFFHEQSRKDRDEYIEIVWRNVQNGADDQFEKYNFNVIDHLNEQYDYSSIMHYGPYAFSGSGRKTILPRKVGVPGLS
uniref:Metalloendopeptidase n=1 Tax=Angiostrongylus cantonensis TaxID=6313 RepID=A0A0K0CTW1_ANGCA